MQRAIDIYIAKLGPEHPHTMTSKRDFAHMEAELTTKEKKTKKKTKKRQNRTEI